MNNSSIQYFIIFRKFNGLISGSILSVENSTLVIPRLPVGEKITLVAFAKSKGILYQCKEDVTLTKNATIPLKFKSITTEEMNRIFKSNVKI